MYMIKCKEVKCIIWDLDNTIWNGILLEDSSVELKPGIVDLLEKLDDRGILLSIASKNDRDTAINKLKEFKLDHYFLYPQINWQAKSKSVKEIASKLNIGVDTVLFIDDDVYELQEVNSELPEVCSLHADHYDGLCERANLASQYISIDGKRRRHMYLDDQQRQLEEEQYVGPKEAFLASLQMNLTITLAEKEDLLRCEELTKRTNQLNSTGLTYSCDDLEALLNSGHHRIYVCELSDRIGSYGKIGLALIDLVGTDWRVKLFITSCRVISRGIGTVFLSYLINEAKNSGATRFLADFKQTTKNKMMYITFKFNQFTELERNDDQILFMNIMESNQVFPAYIYIQTEKDETKWK